MAMADMRDFRDALGCFTTGVTVVTARSKKGDPVGLTATSFNSVSMEPPLVLWSLGRDAGTAAAFLESDHFAIHVLGASQQDMSQKFATRDVDRFEGLECAEGAGGVPLIPGCVARFQCRKYAEYDGGDHVIMVGEVLAYDHTDEPALAFYRSGYANVSR